MLKAVAGGGGRGMRVAHDADELARVFPIAQLEAQAHFGQGGLYLERLIERGHHVEIQIAADRQGNVVHLGERECSVQRRHQKMIEESPSPMLEPGTPRGDGRHRVRRASRSSATRTSAPIEFLVDADANFYFLEMNTRLQVEHPVTELVTGIDLVKLQIASGRRRAAAVQPAGHRLARPRDRVPRDLRGPVARLRAGCRATSTRPTSPAGRGSASIRTFSPATRRRRTTIRCWPKSWSGVAIDRKPGANASRGR